MKLWRAFVQALEVQAERPWNFYLNLLANTGLATFLLALGSWQAGQNLLWYLLLPLGFLAWGPFEYACHRWFFHSPRSPSNRGHALHHRRPMDLIAVPFFFGSVVAVCLYYSLTLILPGALVAFFLSGMAAGYVYYGVIHHALHHLPWVQRSMHRLHEHHELHHRYPKFNFGVSVRYLDHLFGTSITLQTAPANRSARS